MSSPLNTIRPLVSSYAGFASSVLASVDFPEPFGPMSAWTSPGRADRVRPFRIGLPSAATARSSISSRAWASVTASMIIALCP